MFKKICILMWRRSAPEINVLNQVVFIPVVEFEALYYTMNIIYIVFEVFCSCILILVYCDFTDRVHSRDHNVKLYSRIYWWYRPT